MAAKLAARLLRRRAAPNLSEPHGLAQRATELSERYFRGRAVPAEVRWVSNQEKTRWGSCTPATGTIRISTRLRQVPPWVLDSVLLHELAHLLDSSHGPAFKDLVARYPRTADAGLWLAGYSQGLADRARDSSDGPA
jgi:predicted metal-dependent hydrolase